MTTESRIHVLSRQQALDISAPLCICTTWSDTRMCLCKFDLFGSCLQCDGATSILVRGTIHPVLSRYASSNGSNPGYRNILVGVFFRQKMVVLLILGWMGMLGV